MLSLLAPTEGEYLPIPHKMHMLLNVEAYVPFPHTTIIGFVPSTTPNNPELGGDIVAGVNDADPDAAMFTVAGFCAIDGLTIWNEKMYSVPRVTV